MTTKYDRGRKFEYLTRNWLIREGYYVIRSAGSHTAFDLVVFPLLGCNDIGLDKITPFGIQLKGKDLTGITNAKLKQILDSKELEEFRNINLAHPSSRKFLFIYNTRNVKQLPIIYEYGCSNKWIRLDGQEEIEKENVPTIMQDKGTTQTKNSFEFEW